ncbi:hypothetical protein LOTGIDRAFT_165859 [Lottia gigantea]|uniref:Uncharacterized protein n=1 Tax=Lottia gigantea TaxID=225164 RepID=V3ZUT1_LOTGI|nr:hypothetical protein LOTGIDRAFT_165859 [Lottia gigantea]ESO88122.1 hypothetical protein LOTGIDRAFT_165859 [Lottia gigantea]
MATFQVYLFLFISYILITGAEEKLSKFAKISENEEVIPPSGGNSWFPVRSKIFCSTVCISLGVSCNGFQFKGESKYYNVSSNTCAIIQYNIVLYTRQESAGISVYLHKDHADQTVATSVSTRKATYITSAIDTTLTTTNVPTTDTPTCNVDAALTLPDRIVLFSDSMVYFYSDLTALFSTPYNSMPVSSFLTGSTGSVDAAYTDVTSQYIFIIQGTDVHKHILSDGSLDSSETISQHFSQLSTIPTHIDGVMYYNNDVIVISSDIVRRYSSSKTVSVSTNSANNVFKSSNHHLAPSGVTAVTQNSNEAYIFSNSRVYKFTAGNKKGTWEILGDVVC